MPIKQLDYYAQSPSAAPTASATGGTFRVRHRRILPNEKYTGTSPEVTDANLDGTLMLTPEGYSDVDNILRDQFEIFDGTDWRIIPTTTTGAIAVTETAIPTTGANAWAIAPVATTGNQDTTGAGNISFGAIASGSSPARIWMLLNEEGQGSQINSLTFNPFRGTDADKESANDLDDRLQISIEGVGTIAAGNGILNSAFNDTIIWSRDGTALNRMAVTCPRGSFIKCRVTMVNTPAGGSGTSVLAFNLETFSDRKLSNISSIYPDWPARQILYSPERGNTLPVVSAGANDTEVNIGKVAVSYSAQFAAFNEDQLTLPLTVADTYILYLTASGNYNIIPQTPANQTFTKPSTALDVLTFEAAGNPVNLLPDSENLLIPATAIPFVTLGATLEGLRCVTSTGAYATTTADFFGVLTRGGVATDVRTVDRFKTTTCVSNSAIAVGDSVEPTTDGKVQTVASGGIGIAITAAAAGDRSVVVELGTVVSSTGGGGGINNVVEDTTPQLGGPLDVSGQSIVSASNGNIVILPDGTGRVLIHGLTYPDTDGTNDQVLTTDGAGNLAFTSKAAGTANDSTISVQALTADLTLPNATTPRWQVLDPGGANRTINLSGGGHYKVINNSNGTFGLTLDQGGTTVATLNTTTDIKGVEVIYTGSEWLVIQLGRFSA